MTLSDQIAWCERRLEWAKNDPYGEGEAEYAAILASLTELRGAENALRWMADEANWREAEGCEVKRMGNSGEQRGIVLYSWGLAPWVFARSALPIAAEGE